MPNAREEKRLQAMAHLTARYAAQPHIQMAKISQESYISQNLESCYVNISLGRVPNGEGQYLPCTWDDDTQQYVTTK